MAAASSALSDCTVRVRPVTVFSRRRAFPSSGFLCVVMLITMMVMPPSLSSETYNDVLDRTSFTGVEAAAVRNEFRKASDAGIPESFLLPRLKEGIAKNIPVFRILEVLVREKTAFTESLILLKQAGYGDPPSAADWQRTAHLLLTGVDRDAVDVLLSAFSGRRSAYRAGTSLYLAFIRWGIDPDTAVRLTSAAAASKIDPDSFMGIIDILTEARHERIRTDEMIRRLLDALPEADSIERMRDRILF